MTTKRKRYIMMYEGVPHYFVPKDINFVLIHNTKTNEVIDWYTSFPTEYCSRISEAMVERILKRWEAGKTEFLNGKIKQTRKGAENG
jgi:hypothetical protein